METNSATQPAEPARRIRLRPYWALVALIAGLALGAWSGALAQPLREGTLSVAQFVGTLWLNALKMTVIPLVVALLVTGIARGAEAAQGGRIAARSVLWIVIICTASALFGAFAITLLAAMFPLPRAIAGGLQDALASVEQKASEPLPGSR
jgi:Na+/H+-dicarboxylate symporter